MKSRPKIFWKMEKICNFNCSYCGITNKVEYNYVPTEAITKTLRKLGKEWILVMLGGEPLLHPNFVELCKTVTKTNDIRIVTNLSITTKVKNFAENIDPGKVHGICVSAHIEEREKRGLVEEFIQNVLLLKGRNFNVHVTYVLLPTLIKKFKSDYEYFKTRGILLIPKPLRGGYDTITGQMITKETPGTRIRFSNIFKAKPRAILHCTWQCIHKRSKLPLQGIFTQKYPESYTEEERKIFSSLNPSYESKRPFYSKGMKCHAGKTSLVIQPSGLMTRCGTDKRTIMGNVHNQVKLYTKSESCTVDLCTIFKGENTDKQSLKIRVPQSPIYLNSELLQSNNES